MNCYTFKNTIAVVTLTWAASIGSALNVSAEPHPTPSTSSSSAEPTESLATKRKLLAERQQTLEHEALDVVSGTQHALMALEKLDTKKALSLLQDVSGKLDILQAKFPGLNLIPANVEADVFDFEGNSKQIQNLVDKADQLLKAHKVQEARHLLAELVSEVRVTTTSIPLGTFPVAIKDATKLIDQGKTNEAKIVLYDVVNLMVKTTEIMPLPVLSAEVLLTTALELEHKTDLTQEASRAEILKLADTAKDKLKLAEVLGYGAKDDYKQLYMAIDEIKRVMFSEKSATAWDKLITSLSALKNKLIHPAK